MVVGRLPICLPFAVYGQSAQWLCIILKQVIASINHITQLRMMKSCGGDYCKQYAPLR